MIWWGKIVDVARGKVTAIDRGPGFDYRNDGGGREVS